MSVHTKSAVFTSVSIHVIAIGALLLFVLLGSCKEKTPLHVLELVSLPVDTVMPPLPPEAEPLDNVPLTVPEIVEMPDIQRPDIPDLTPEPPPPPPPKAPPPPTPTPKAPTPTPPPPPKAISYEEFIRKEGRPTEPTQRTPAPRPAPKAPQIDLSQIRKGLERVAQPTSPTAAPPTQRELEAMAGFERMLTRQIDIAWNKPPEASARDLVTVVSFTVQADGRITDVRVTRSSGNSSFDNSTLAAVRNARGFGTPPNRQANTYTIPFRLAER